MKTAIFIEGDAFQVVLTPETEIEKSLLKMVDGDHKISVLHGSFYETRGGWVREANEPSSLIIRLLPPEVAALPHLDLRAPERCPNDIATVV